MFGKQTEHVCFIKYLGGWLEGMLPSNTRKFLLNIFKYIIKGKFVFKITWRRELVLVDLLLLKN